MTLQYGTPSWEALRSLLSIEAEIPTSSNLWAIKDYQSDIQLTKLISKYPFDGAAEIAEDNAIMKLLEQESRNKVTNKRWTIGDFSDDEISLISRVSSTIGRVLGPPPTLEQIAENAAWGPGTLNGYDFSSVQTGAELKFAATATATPMLIPIAEQVLQKYPAWHRQLTCQDGRLAVSVLAHDQLFTVKKKFEMDRCAFKPPVLNAWLQRGIGITIRNRLQRVGLNLQFQQEVNREFARIGSATGLFATLDLSSASDSICRQMLKSILSPDWYTTLFATSAQVYQLSRSYCERHGLDPDSLHPYQMMSAMGCGYTFELETALFYAICTSVVPAVWVLDSGKGGKAVRQWPHVKVYGDDIIVPSAYAARVISALTLFGLSVNEQKSHIGRSPGFRESCGGDFLYGAAVRPLYIQRKLCDGPAIVRTANRVLEMAAARYEEFTGDDRFLDRSLAPLHSGLVNLLPARVRRFLKTPPFVTGGLWEVQSVEIDAPSRAKPDEFGDFTRYWLTFQSRAADIDLSQYGFWYDNAWPQKANGWNLMAARLYSLGAPKLTDEESRYSSLPLGVGDKTVMRSQDEVGLLRLTKSRITRRSRWRGWA
jgi:hypothetical protein